MPRSGDWETVRGKIGLTQVQFFLTVGLQILDYILNLGKVNINYFEMTIDAYFCRQTCINFYFITHKKAGNSTQRSKGTKAQRAFIDS
jgi:hypothetical protein